MQAAFVTLCKRDPVWIRCAAAERLKPKVQFISAVCSKETDLKPRRSKLCFALKKSNNIKT